MFGRPVSSLLVSRFLCIESNSFKRNNSKMHAWFILFTALITVCGARPNGSNGGLRLVTPAKGIGAHIVGGSDASPGEFPWQLVLTAGVIGSLRCGGTLLDANYGLTAAHCVDGTLASSLQVTAGLYNRKDLSETQTVDISGYTMHPSYTIGSAYYANDVAILNFASPVVIGGVNVQAAVLPGNNDDYTGVTCHVTGWGETGVPTPPIVLQKASVSVITIAQCSSIMTGIGVIWDNHICVQDPVGNGAACHGDDGGPLNCPEGGVTLVVGLGSVVVSGGVTGCSQYPSIYTRVWPYLGWIEANTP